MQEEIERRTFAISATTTKLTGRTLAIVLQAAMRKIQREQQKAHTPHGRQSVEKLMNHGVNTNSIPLDGDTKLFDRMARKYNVDYAFHKTGPKKYLLFFKAGQADAITACFSEYTKRVMARGKHSFKKEFDKTVDMVRAKKPRQHERKREAAHDDR